VPKDEPNDTLLDDSLAFIMESVLWKEFWQMNPIILLFDAVVIQ